ncbi:MAG: peptidylprolyl isomerase [Sedimenticola sp.]|uniref:Peptidyl-prolyl cis-trans isomerase n=1 Tax=Sedimenticola thiotaurini TaxID=1543721 RepID=A0A558CSF3_9GAMM|nr:peptidylprolyl isomerase [Sedimenticola sp.]TVT51698.1 MAG: peptidylprolyl isomerase [Sedimenticola thiotaurini]MCW8882076.1 peptidylprolyl isomerase [Sedimenticola sp.]MCW8921633.1 peptidylprolyl isomerase [Sedimenticola sp.]MCW8946620.1 peptidylprolyl isomerase [Sedimenticola sp.]
MQISKDKVVTIEYTMKDQLGNLLDTSDNGDPISFIQGKGGVFPALEAALDGKSIGERLQVTLTPEQAYGQTDERLIKIIPRDKFKVEGEPQVGSQFRTRRDDTDVVVTIVKVDDESVVVDANPPLAGVTILMDIVIVEVRDAVEEELRTGQVQNMDEIYEKEHKKSMAVELK